MAAKIKRGDTVIAIAGKDFGRRGEVIKVLPSEGKAVVGGLNHAIKHQRQTAERPGGRVPVEMPMDLSNLALIDPTDQRPTRVGFRFEDGKKVRYSKRTGERIDG